MLHFVLVHKNYFVKAQFMIWLSKKYFEVIQIINITFFISLEHKIFSIIGNIKIITNSKDFAL